MNRKILVGKVYLGSGKLLSRGHVVIQDEKIVHVGLGDLSDEQDAEVIDLNGKLILPGLADCHLHLVAYALSRRRLDLSDVTSLEDALALIRKYVARLGSGEWLLGRGWDKQRLRLDHFPDRWMLDRVAPDNPVALDSHDGHLVWVNTAALARLGLTGKLPRIEGGRIETDARGVPKGIFMEKAVALVRHGIEAEQHEGILDAISDASQQLLRHGITSVHTIENHHQARYLDEAIRRGKLPLRLFRMEEVGSVADVENINPSTQCVKLYADGALGSQTAYMFEPYAGDPNNVGIKSTDRVTIEEIALAAARKGLAVAVHAIGDRANSEVLDAYEVVRKQFPLANLRMEHAQVLREADIERFARLEIIASMQPIHVVSDMDIAGRYWGQRCQFAYAWRSLYEAGVKLAFGSDAPIEEPDPLKGIHAAVTRRKPDGTVPWYPQQCLPVSQAIDCYTAGAALASSDAASGSITPGKRADLTVLQDDIVNSNDSDIVLQTSVRMTVVGGQVLYDAS